MVDTRVVLIVIAAYARVRREVIHVREGDAGPIRASPKVRQHFRRGIEPIGGDDVAWERLAGNNLVATGISGASSITEPAAGCQRIVDRYQGSAGVADV